MKKFIAKTNNGKDNANRVRKIISLLKKEYSVIHTALEYHNPIQLLIAVILSAQCTDTQVNKVTPALFNSFPTINNFANAELKAIEHLIYSTGFYKNKAKNIRECCRMLLERYNGVIPDTMHDLIQLPGVGRKTANVVLGEVFNKIEGIVVDTHVMRLSKRLGLTKQKKDAVKIESDLMSIVPKKMWFEFSHTLIFHGRKICKARKPLCRQCNINKLCPSSTV